VHEKQRLEQQSVACSRRTATSLQHNGQLRSFGAESLVLAEPPTTPAGLNHEYGMLPSFQNGLDVGCGPGAGAILVPFCALNARPCGLFTRPCLQPLDELVVAKHHRQHLPDQVLARRTLDARRA
jgi:hypothetical protein